MKLETIIAVIKDLAGVPGRFEVVDGGQNYTVIVDYAHTPDSLENVLKLQNNLQKVMCIVSLVVVAIGPNEETDNGKCCNKICNSCNLYIR